MGSRFLAIVVGAGPGLGFSICKAFAEKSYAVALVSRSIDKLQPLADSLVKAGHEAKPFSIDVSDPKAITEGFKQISAAFKGYPLKVAVFNSSYGFGMKPFIETDINEIQKALQLNGVGAAAYMQTAAKHMLEHKQGGSILLTGSTASLKGGAKFAAFASGQFAMRALAQSAARSLGPQGIHVAEVIVDGLIDTERVQSMMGKAKEEGTRLNPDSIAQSYVHLAEQPPDCWTFELDVRPAKETW